jgi:hypothetical protein
MHPNEELIRRFYDARAANDRPGVRACMADDIAWHDPYPEPHGGDLRGPDAVFAQIFDAAGEITGHSLRISLHDVLGTDDHAAALVDWSASIPGKGRIDGREVAVFHVADGKITEVWFFPQDQYTYEEFFS